jgi:hypothetical protein
MDYRRIALLKEGVSDSRTFFPSLLYSGKPETRELMRRLTRDIDGRSDLPDLPSDSHKEADHEGVYHTLPPMMLEV